MGLVDQAVENGGEVVLAKDGRPVSRLARYREKQSLPFGRHRNEIGILDEMVSPLPSAWFEEPHWSDAVSF